VTGLAGLVWVWTELAPQRFGFEDTDDPAVGLQFLAAHPGSHASAGLWLMIASLALIATVLEVAGRLGQSDAREPEGRSAPLGTSYLRVIGLLAGALLLVMALTRLAEGPVRHVQSLDQAWGETAYLITQFVGVQLAAVGGLFLLALWIAGTVWLGVRRGLVPRPLAMLALLPSVRIAGVLGPLGVEVEGFWLLSMAAIPAAFAWLALLGAWPVLKGAGSPIASPEPARL